MLLENNQKIEESKKVFVNILLKAISDYQDNKTPIIPLNYASNLLNVSSGYKRENPNLIREFDSYYQKFKKCDSQVLNCHNLGCIYSKIDGSCDLIGQLKGFMLREFKEYLPRRFSKLEEIEMENRDSILKVEDLFYFYVGIKVSEFQEELKKGNNLETLIRIPKKF